MTQRDRAAFANPTLGSPGPLRASLSDAVAPARLACALVRRPEYLEDSAPCVKKSASETQTENAYRGDST